ncbi:MULTISPECIES: carbohydrate ABC transporter permease [Paenibacillus]|uniref:carbohydrate ABC transporter permease n=1 Tax=Paenibacillus TaxID=44249 RepID=UPI0007BF388D|nr:MULTISPECIES: carbohydrate ABC transporter permease [Paenibacillus]MCZ1266569.1 carbohydrate ABC transporter permease [Paenibacillus tundrae]OAX49741.1 L-arabinose transport system permease protein AraQ [Paenibacillus sp. AD87]WDQ35576.1 carbohydrate ABC transporter permease [Paenibacillus marchantiae]SDJ90418.1 carbohydrate ABC transporter membrane protein 2, CUT1 family [Paenibacillus sp. OK060]SEA19557.1 putative aldouronate transport system permease protein [Paenibacillus sp. 276b]
MILNRFGDRIFKIIVYFILILVLLVTFLPFWNILVLSLNSAEDTVRGGVYLWPRDLTLDSYQQILKDSEILNGLWVTVKRTLIGAPLSVLVITMLAYPLSRRNLVGRKGWNLYFIFTMYFSGGLIPFYMVLKALNMIDTFSVFILPSLMNVFYMIIVRTFMEQLPHEIEESARVDGANDLTIFFRIVMPLTTPVLATIGLFQAIGHWNAWFDSYAFTYSSDLKTLQAVLVKILNQFQTGGMISQSQMLANSAKRNAVSSDTIRMAATMVATLPIVMVYPFLQKYFVKGMTLGAVKS